MVGNGILERRKIERRSISTPTAYTILRNIYELGFEEMGLFMGLHRKKYNVVETKLVFLNISYCPKFKWPYQRTKNDPRYIYIITKPKLISKHSLKSYSKY